MPRPIEGSLSPRLGTTLLEVFTFDVSVGCHAVTEQLHVSLYRLHPDSLWLQISTISFNTLNSWTIRHRTDPVTK